MNSSHANKILKFLGFRIAHRRVRKAIRKRKKNNTKEYALLREEARAIVHARLEYFNQFYGFSYNKVFIKNTKTRWGSCSSKRNLNFSYKIAKLAPHLQDYIIVHELCHLKEFNHGKVFWELVALHVPDHATCRNELKGMTI